MYLREFMDIFSYPEEAKSVLVEAYNTLERHKEAKKSFDELLCRYKEDKMCDFLELLQSMKQVSVLAGVHEYTGNMLLLICMSETLARYYDDAGIDRDVFVTSMYDLKWKLIECQCVHGVWGTFVPTWYRGFFQMQLFGFEKLQFELISFKREYERDGMKLNPDSIVLNTHIPRTGTKLDEESLRKSYRNGAAFFKKHFGIELPVFVCHSWLLFPKNKEILYPESNLLRFVSDYELYDWGEYDDYREVWRLFDVMYDGNVDHLPQNTSFRRGYAQWIRTGQKTGWGYGIYIYKEGE